MGKSCVDETIMPPRLFREAKKCEEEEGAQDDRPSGQLERENVLGIVLPHDVRNLLNVRIIAVDLGPAPPFLYTKLDIKCNPKRP
jgi:hypothetical protein